MFRHVSAGAPRRLAGAMVPGALSILSRAGRVLADVVLPRVCSACGALIGTDDRDLCESCATDLVRCVAGAYCRHCGEDRSEHLLHNGVCTSCTLGKSRTKWQSFVRVGRYDGPLKSMILQFKTRFTLDRILGGLLADAVCGMMNPEAVDLWVPIPTHWSRRLGTGFQPTALLARAAAGRWGGRVEHLLRMARYVEPFHARPGLSAADRAKEIAGAMRPAAGATIAGRRVCVIDDVTTTGATLREAARVLKAAGAASVSAAVLARAVRSRRG